VIALLAGGLSPNKYDLHLVVITQTADTSEFAATSLPPTITVHSLGARRIRSAVVPLLRLLRKLRPQLVLSGMFHLSFLVLLLRPILGFRVRILVRQNGTASAALAALPNYHRLLYRLLYRRADCVICQSPAMARDLQESFAIPRSRLKLLPNPIDFDAIRSTSPASPLAWPDSGPHLLAVGRLSPEKGFDILLTSLSLVRQQFPSADLLIAGIGADEPALKVLSRTLSLDSAVRFLGHVAAPASYFPVATLFVLSSHHEGLPNAMLEAAAAGLPIVSTRASEGIVELVDQQPGAWLAAAATCEALADTLITALKTLQPGQRINHAFVAPFALNSALVAWEEFIDQSLADAPPAKLHARATPANEGSVSRP
jgi:glycosyltransferase involved in cell wall biosynthesis